MKEVLLVVLSGMAFALLSIFGSDIAFFQTEYKAIIVSGVVTLLVIKMSLINAWFKDVEQIAHNACTAFEIAINLLVLAYHLSNTLSQVAAYVGVLGWVSVLVFIGAMLIMWVRQAELRG